jgi:hypothetical protein
MDRDNRLGGAERPDALELTARDHEERHDPLPCRD